MHVFRRKDIARLRLTLRKGQAPVELDIVHLDLYFFHDLDVVLLNPEVCANNLPLDTVRDMLFRILPVGCKVAILPPDVTLIVSPAEAAPHA